MSEKKSNFIAVFKKYFRKDEVWLIPNILCYVRVLLIILFLIFYLVPMNIAGNEYANIYIACAMMVIASYTDFLDGFIARKFNQRSELGRIIDPLSDKLLQCAVSAALCINLYEYPMVWAMFGVFVFKEFTMFLELIILATRGKSFKKAHWYGKASTFIFYLVLGTLLIGVPFIDAYSAGATATTINSLCGVAIFVLSFALIMYVILAVKIYKHGETEIDVPSEPKKEEEITKGDQK